MINLSEKQEIARENGRKSHGPVTQEGKQRSSLNAITHGLASKCVVLSNESEELYSHLLSSYQEQFPPADIGEQHLVTQIVNAYWRLRRIWSMETALFDSEMFAQKEDFEAAWSQHHPAMRVVDVLTAIQATNPATLTTLNRYEVRYQRIYRSSVDQLRKLRRDRHALDIGVRRPTNLPDATALHSPGEELPHAPAELVASTNWQARFLAIFVAILSALHIRSCPVKTLRARQKVSFCTNEPTAVYELPFSNFHLPELFAWLSVFTRTPARPKADFTRPDPEKLNAA